MTIKIREHFPLNLYYNYIKTRRVCQVFSWFYFGYIGGIGGEFGREFWGKVWVNGESGSFEKVFVAGEDNNTSPRFNLYLNTLISFVHFFPHFTIF